MTPRPQRMLAGAAALWLALLATAVFHGLAAEAPGDAPRLADAIAGTRRDIAEALDALNARRDAIAAERKPLAAELEALQRRVQARRAEAERLRTLRYQTDLEREAQGRDAQELREARDFAFTVLGEYRRALETRLEPAESLALADTLAAVDGALEGADDPGRFADAADRLLQLAETWNRRKLGGMLVGGHCLDAAGLEHAGRFAVIGPLTYFAADDGRAAGLVVTRLGSARPSLFGPLKPSDPAAFANLAAGEEAAVPVDPTRGDALKVATASRSLAEQARSGGFTMIPLLAVGVAAAVLAIWKIIVLRRLRVPTAALLDRLAAQVRAGELEAARRLAESLGRPLSPLLHAGIEHRAARREHLEEIMHERALAALPVLDRHLGMLAVLGGVAPLLGLLGTVTGMIHTFQLVTIFGTGDAKLLSGGISEALVTTETGLIIAVPVLIVHALLTRRVRTIVSALEQAVVGYVNRLHAGATGGA